MRGSTLGVKMTDELLATLWFDVGLKGARRSTTLIGRGESVPALRSVMIDCSGDGAPSQIVLSEPFFGELQLSLPTKLKEVVDKSAGAIMATVGVDAGCGISLALDSDYNVPGPSYAISLDGLLDDERPKTEHRERSSNASGYRVRQKDTFEGLEYRLDVNYIRAPNAASILHLRNLRPTAVSVVARVRDKDGIELVGICRAIPGRSRALIVFGEIVDRVDSLGVDNSLGRSPDGTCSWLAVRSRDMREGGVDSVELWVYNAASVRSDIEHVTVWDFEDSSVLLHQFVEQVLEPGACLSARFVIPSGHRFNVYLNGVWITQGSERVVKVENESAGDAVVDSGTAQSPGAAFYWTALRGKVGRDDTSDSVELRVYNATAARTNIEHVVVRDLEDLTILSHQVVRQTLKPDACIELRFDIPRVHGFCVYVDGAELPQGTVTPMPGSESAPGATGKTDEKSGGFKPREWVGCLPVILFLVLVLAYGCDEQRRRAEISSTLGSKTVAVTVADDEGTPTEESSKKSAQKEDSTENKSTKKSSPKKAAQKEDSKKDEDGTDEDLAQDAAARDEEGTQSGLVSLRFDGNGADGGEMASLSLDSGVDDIVLPECGFTRSRYRFVGWDVYGRTYQPGDTVLIKDLPSDGVIRAKWTFDAPVEELLTSRYVETSGVIHFGEGEETRLPMAMYLVTNISDQTLDVSLGYDGDIGLSGLFSKMYQRALAPGESTWLLGTRDEDDPSLEPMLVAESPDSRFSESIISATKVEEVERSGGRVVFRVVNVSEHDVCLTLQWLLVEPNSEVPGYQSSNDVQCESDKASSLDVLKPGEGATVTFTQEGASWEGRELWYCPSGSVIM